MYTIRLRKGKLYGYAESVYSAAGYLSCSANFGVKENGLTLVGQHSSIHRRFRGANLPELSPPLVTGSGPVTDSPRHLAAAEGRKG